MAGTVNIPLTTLAPGTYHFGPAALADTDTKAVLTVDRTPAGGFNSKAATTTAQITVEQSDDSGATWFLLISGGFTGGIFTDKYAGGTVAANIVGVTLAPGTGREGRATVVIGGPSSVAVQGSLVIS